jgi:hypothetical protein
LAAVALDSQPDDHGVPYPVIGVYEPLDPRRPYAALVPLLWLWEAGIEPTAAVLTDDPLPCDLSPTGCPACRWVEALDAYQRRRQQLLDLDHQEGKHA